MSVSFKAVESGPVDGVPDTLVCGECGAPSGDVLWQAVEVQGEVIGLVGFANCSRCRRTISGILAHDPETMDQLRSMVEASLLDS